MTAASFVDTNVLVYADDLASPEKQRRAQALIAELMLAQHCWLSVQVLQEYFAVATRKLRLDPALVRQRVESYADLNVVTFAPADVLHAIDLHRRYGFSIWDALIVRAALLGECRRLYSEDLQPGFKIENLEIVNPFAG